MTAMSVVNVIQIVYPGQLESDHIGVGREDDGTFFFTKWDVEGQPEPTIESLEAMIPSLQSQFDLWYFLNIGTPQLRPYLDSVAQERQYDSAVSCASYANSTVTQWKSEAETFIAWRDDVFSYTLAQVALMQSAERSVPTFEAFKTELPVIVWP